MCTGLVHLCLNLYEIEEDRDESDILGRQADVAYTPNDFETGLQALASINSLRTLRLTNPPEYRKAFHALGDFLRFFRRNLQSGTERVKFQARADGVLRYLGEHGSNIEGLAFAPVQKLKRAADTPDKQGHIWPNYYYFRGKTTDRKGIDVALARPLVEWNEEFPNANIRENQASRTP